MTDATDSTKFLGRRLNRRALMRGSLVGGAGLAAAALIGCGGSGDDETDAGADLAALRASRASRSAGTTAAATDGHAPAATDEHAAPADAHAAATDEHAAPAAHDDAPHWTYAGAGGPEEWGSIDPDFAACSVGRNQSPINISNTAGVGWDAVSFNYVPSALTVINNGHTIQANVPPRNSRSSRTTTSGWRTPHSDDRTPHGAPQTAAG